MNVLILDKPLGELGDAGEILHIDDDALAESLVSAGYAHEATEDEINGGGGDAEETADDPAMIAEAVKGLTKRAEKAVAEATAKGIEQAEKRFAGRTRPQPVINDAPHVHVVANHGFKSPGDFAQTIAASERGSRSANDRLQRGMKSMRTKDQMSEGTAADGGYLVPVEYSQELFAKIWDQPNLLNKCVRYPIKGNNIKVRATNDQSGTESVIAYWVDETNAVTDSKGKFNQVDLTLKKLGVLVNVTDELLDDSPTALQAHLDQYVPQKITFALNQAILTGTGGGSQANIVGNAATVVVTRKTSSRITYTDIAKMRARMWAASWAKSEFVINPSIISELDLMAFVDSTGTQPAYMPAMNGGYPNAAFAPIGTLFGRNVITCEAAPVLGTKGDIGLYDWSQVACAYKDIAGAMSIHLFFDKFISSFRYGLRVDTASLWLGPWTRADGVTASPFVVLSSLST